MRIFLNGIGQFGLDTFNRLREAGQRVSRAEFESNLAAKLNDELFRADLRGLLRPDVVWDLDAAAQAVRERLLARLVEDLAPEQQRRDADFGRPHLQEEQRRGGAGRRAHEQQRLPGGHRAEAHARNRPFRNVLRMISSNGASASARM